LSAHASDTRRPEPSKSSIIVASRTRFATPLLCHSSSTARRCVRCSPRRNRSGVSTQVLGAIRPGLARRRAADFDAIAPGTSGALQRLTGTPREVAQLPPNPWLNSAEDTFRQFCGLARGLWVGVHGCPSWDHASSLRAGPIRAIGSARRHRRTSAGNGLRGARDRFRAHRVSSSIARP